MFAKTRAESRALLASSFGFWAFLGKQLFPTMPEALALSRPNLAAKSVTLLEPAVQWEAGFSLSCNPQRLAGGEGLLSLSRKHFLAKSRHGNH